MSFLSKSNFVFIYKTRPIKNRRTSNHSILITLMFWKSSAKVLFVSFDMKDDSKLFRTTNNFKDKNLHAMIIFLKVPTREHWTGEVSADEWVPVFPVFNWPLVLWKKYFVFIKTTYSSRYSFVAGNSRYSLYQLSRIVQWTFSHSTN